jgi:hypothetical protein
MSYKTVVELAQKYSVSVPAGSTGKKLVYEEINPVNFKIDSDYQRLISRASLKKQGQLDWTLCVPAVVAKRPDSLGEDLGGHWVIDGQHKTIKLIQSGENATLPCMVYYHEENATYEECKKSEAQIFFALNTQRKKLNKIDEIRAGIITGDPESLWIEEVMKTLNVQFDAFGSTQNDTKEIKSFSHFYQACVEAYDKHKKTGSMTSLKRGYDLLLEMYPKDDYITGYAFRACVLMNMFIEDALSNGKRDSFYSFIRFEMPRTVSQERLTKGFTNYNADRYVLHSVIKRYAEFCDATKVKVPYRIGADTLLGAANIYSRFTDPNFDEDDKNNN